MDTIEMMARKFGAELEEKYDDMILTNYKIMKAEKGPYIFVARKDDDEEKLVSFTFDYSEGSRCKHGNNFENMGFDGAYERGFIQVGYWESDSEAAEEAYKYICNIML